MTAAAQASSFFQNLYAYMCSYITIHTREVRALQEIFYCWQMWCLYSRVWYLFIWPGNFRPRSQSRSALKKLKQFP